MDELAGQHSILLVVPDERREGRSREDAPCAQPHLRVHAADGLPEFLTSRTLVEPVLGSVLLAASRAECVHLVAPVSKLDRGQDDTPSILP